MDVEKYIEISETDKTNIIPVLTQLGSYIQSGDCANAIETLDSIAWNMCFYNWTCSAAVKLGLLDRIAECADVRSWPRPIQDKPQQKPAEQCFIDNFDVVDRCIEGDPRMRWYLVPRRDDIECMANNLEGNLVYKDSCVVLRLRSIHKRLCEIDAEWWANCDVQETALSTVPNRQL